MKKDAYQIHCYQMDSPQNGKRKKKSLTTRLKEIILKRRSHESTTHATTHDSEEERIYDITASASPQPAAPPPASLFIQLGQDIDSDSDDQSPVPGRERMEWLLMEDRRVSWPLERLEALKLDITDPDGKRSSVAEAVERAKEHRRSLHEAIPMPNVIAAVSPAEDDSDSSASSDQE